MKRAKTRGITMKRGDPGFEKAVLATSYNARNPGRCPDILVQANDDAEVVEAVNRARREALKISICSGGHSWAQNHIRDGGLLLDLSRLDGVSIDAKNERAVVEPGCDGSSLNDLLKQHGLSFPIPHAAGVCMGGFLLQGGFGWNGPNLGVGCQNVVGLDVVLADGSQVHASQTENADLYWAAPWRRAGFIRRRSALLSEALPEASESVRTFYVVPTCLTIRRSISRIIARMRNAA